MEANMQNKQSFNRTTGVSPNVHNYTMDIDSFLNSLNEEFKPNKETSFTKLVDLPQNTKLSIKGITPFSNKYGDKLVIELHLNQIKFTVFLPDRFVKLPPEYIEYLVSNPNINFVYTGKDSKGSHQINWTK